MRNDYILITRNNNRKWKENYFGALAMRKDLNKKVASAKLEAIQLQLSLLKEAGKGFMSYIQQDAVAWKTDEGKVILETFKWKTEK